jgi:hypothetical protein
MPDQTNNGKRLLRVVAAAEKASTSRRVHKTTGRSQNR